MSKNFSANISVNLLVNDVLYEHISAKTGSAQANVFVYADEGFDPENDFVGDCRKTLSQIDFDLIHHINVGDRVQVVAGACDRTYLADLVASRKAAAERRGYRKVAKAYRKAARRVKPERETLGDALGDELVAKLRKLAV